MGDPGFHMADCAWNRLFFPVSMHVMLQLFEVDRKKFHFFLLLPLYPKQLAQPLLHSISANMFYFPMSSWKVQDTSNTKEDSVLYALHHTNLAVSLNAWIITQNRFLLSTTVQFF